MKIIKIIIITIVTLFAFLIIDFWFYTAFNPIVGGCVDTTKSYGWPQPFYTTSGYHQICGDGFIPAKFHFWGLIIDIVVLATIVYWIRFIYKKVTQKNNK